MSVTQRVEPTEEQRLRLREIFKDRLLVQEIPFRELSTEDQNLFAEFWNSDLITPHGTIKGIESS